MKWVIHLKQVLTAFFWGGTFIAGRYLSHSINPFHAAFLRFSIATVFLFLFLIMQDKKLVIPARAQLFELIILGMTGVFIYNVFFFKGLQTVTAGRASLIIATNPIFISFLSVIIFKEKLTAMKTLGIFISVAGAIVVIVDGKWNQIFSGALGWGELFILFCVFSWVTYSLVGKRVMHQLSPLQTVTWSSLFGTLALLPVVLFNGIGETVLTASWLQWSSLFYLGFFGTVLGFFWYYQGIQVLGAMKTSLYINLVPISAILLAFLILDEPISVWLIIGLILVLTGIFFTNNMAGLIRQQQSPGLLQEKSIGEGDV